MSVINDDSLFCRANTRKLLKNLGLYGVLKKRCRRDSWLLTCINEWCDWPGKSDGGSASAVLPGSCREFRHDLPDGGKQSEVRATSADWLHAPAGRGKPHHNA